MYQTTKQETEMIFKIAQRAEELAETYGVKYERFFAAMDLSAVHMNSVTINLDDLFAADDGNFGHDVFGIRRHLDRQTGKLQDCFLPRYSTR